MSADVDVKLNIKANGDAAMRAVDSLSEKLKGLKADVIDAPRKDYFNNLSSQRKGAMLLAGANAGLDVAEALASFTGGNDGLIKSLRSVEQSTKQYMTALAPLAPPFGAIVGASVGLVTGALKELGRDAEEYARRMAEAAQKLRDSSAKTAITESHAKTPEDRARLQAAAHERMSDYRIKLERGATISEDEVLDAARWNRGLAKKMMERNRNQNGGVLPDKLRALENLYSHSESDEAWLRRDAGFEDGYVPNLSRRDMQRAAATYNDLQRDKEALGPEIVTTARSKSGKAFDKELDSLYAEMTAPKQKPETPATIDTDKLAPPKSKGGELSAKADSWSAMGIGYTGNPMMKTESLLRDIDRDILKLGVLPSAPVAPAFPSAANPARAPAGEAPPRARPDFRVR